MQLTPAFTQTACMGALDRRHLIQYRRSLRCPAFGYTGVVTMRVTHHSRDTCKDADLQIGELGVSE